MDEVKLKAALSAAGNALAAVALACGRAHSAAPGMQAALKDAREAQALIVDLVKPEEPVSSDVVSAEV